MLLQDKVAVIYGAGGAIGSAVARAFAGEGARLFLTGRQRAPVEAVAKDIVAAGGSAEAAEVDALDEQAVDTP
jgi:NADP-dependent 3-hydroxy acid dehydrogenase YdfG